MEPAISAAFCFIIGIVGIWTGLKQLRNRTALNSWKTVKGRVVERGTFQPNTPTLGTPAFRHSPLVKYVYQVGAKEYTNTCIHPKRIQLPQHLTKDWAQKRSASFADEVTVHYNPEDPTESFLIQTPKRTLCIVIGASCLVILVGLIFLIT
jgi:hypothetical protein